METSKQLNIFQFFQKTPDSENQVGGFNRKEEEDRPTTANVPGTIWRETIMCW